MRVSLSLAASIAALGVAATALPTATFAAVDAYLYIDGIDGAAKDPAHQHWIEVSSWSFGQSSSPNIGSSSSGAGAGKAKFGEFTIRKQIDSASPNFFRAAASGRHFAEVKLEMRKAGEGGRAYTTYIMQDVWVTGVNKGGSGDNPMESVTFRFARLQGGDGGVLPFGDARHDSRMTASPPPNVAGRPGPAHPR